MRLAIREDSVFQQHADIAKAIFNFRRIVLDIGRDRDIEFRSVPRNKVHSFAVAIVPGGDFSGRDLANKIRAEELDQSCVGRDHWGGPCWLRRESSSIPVFPRREEPILRMRKRR